MKKTLHVFVALFMLVVLEADLSAQRALQPRIIGGAQAEGDWQWMAAIVDRAEASIEDGQGCGGALIDANWVVTAAHCVEDTLENPVDVVLGVLDLANPGTGYRRVAVDEVILHGSYLTDDDAYDGDIALLRLREPVADLATIPLVGQTFELEPGMMARVIGWGETEAGEASATLRQVDLPLADLHAANLASPEDPPLLDALPAGDPRGGADSCYGDSGGPLMVRDPDSQEWLLAGIVSHGQGECAEPGKFGIYTNVQVHHAWITRHLNPAYSLWLARPLHQADPVTPTAAGLQAFLHGNDRAGLRVALSGSQATLDFPQRVNAGMLQRIQSSPSLTGAWMNVDARPERLTVNGEFEMWRAQLDTGSLPAGARQQFFRLQALPDPAAAGTTVHTGNAFHHQGTLPAGGTERRIHLVDLDPNEPIEMRVVGDGHAPSIALYHEDGETGDLVVAARGGIADPALPFEAALTFTAEAGVRYLIGIRAERQDEAMRFLLQSPPVELGHVDLEPIQPGANIHGQLLVANSTEDAGYLYHDFILEQTFHGQRVIVGLESNPATGGFPVDLAVIDGDDELIDHYVIDDTYHQQVRFVYDDAMAPYTISVSSWNPGDTGNYRLAVAVW